VHSTLQCKNIFIQFARNLPTVQQKNPQWKQQLYGDAVPVSKKEGRVGVKFNIFSKV
jgi:hypothetical protein